LQPFQQLEVWRLSHALALNIHRLSGSIPRAANAGLISQLRRAAQSIPANIAEGCGRNSQREFANFLQIAVGSCSELEYHLLFCADAELVQRVECDARIADVVQARRMLIGLLKRVRTSDGPQSVLRKPTAGSP
jgi:four helix bundle protein